MFLGTDDLVHHLEAITSNLAGAEGQVRRTENRITSAMPAVERNFLYVEQRDLANALSANGAARRDLELARQQVDLILKSVKEYQTK